MLSVPVTLSLAKTLISAEKFAEAINNLNETTQFLGRIYNYDLTSSFF